MVGSRSADALAEDEEEDGDEKHGVAGDHEESDAGCKATLGKHVVDEVACQRTEYRIGVSGRGQSKCPSIRRVYFLPIAKIHALPKTACEDSRVSDCTHLRVMNEDDV